jgi:signal transduction histidine kinase
VNPAFPSILTAITVVVALQPLKTGIQKFVDRKFFRVEYDYREEQRRFLDDIKSSLDIQTLAEKIVTLTNSLIPVHNIGFFILSKPDYRIKMIANNGWDKLKGRSLKFEKEKLKTDLSTPVALIDRVEPGLIIEAADIKVFKKWGMELVFPVKSPTGDIHAFLALGSKKAGTRFLIDDVELLNAVTDTAALAIDRIKLQEDLIREHLEAERLEELNKMKSRFVRTVTHELKTPLTPIKMFVGLLESKLDTQDKKSKEYLSIIDGETDKLKRLIENILDAGKIEGDMKSYSFDKIDLIELVYKVLGELQYQAKMNKQSIIFNDTTKKIFIKADYDEVERALINLMTNAIKYSNEQNITTVYILFKEGFVGIKVKDQGQGIGEDQLEKIFEPYYRSDNESELKAEGTGLGLAIVKHIMDAHDGKIEVKSEIGKGSTFTLWFPELRNE